MGSLPEKHNYGELKLADIVRLLAVCQNKREESKLQTAFYHNVSEDFFDRCAKSVGKLYKGAPDILERIEDLHQDCFLLIFEKVKGFEIQQNWDEKECRKVFLYWMAQFANNLILKAWRKEKKEKKEFDKFIEHLVSDSKSGYVGRYNYKPTYNKEMYDSVWNNMNAMSKEIVLTCTDLEMFKEDGPKHLSKEFRKYLREKYNLTDAAIRQAKGRAIEALNSCKIE